MGRFARRDFALGLAFAHVEGEPLTAMLTSIALFADDDAPPLGVFTMTVSLSTYLRIEDEQLFEVSFSTTVPGQGPVVFWDSAPIELELTLQPEIATRWLPDDVELEEVLDRLAQAFAARTAELVDARSYRWHRALQVQSGSAGTIKQGLRSVFA